MRTATPAAERACRAVVVLASLWFAFTAFWGLFATPSSGHLGAGSAVNVMAAEQMLTWHSVYPSWGFYTGQPPAPNATICHHPFGQYWVAAAFLAVFGHHDFVVHLPPALMSAGIVALLYAVAREKWGVAAGAVAASAYVVVPIAVGFSQFLNVETLCIFGVLLFFWGHSRHMTTGLRRYMAASLAGAGLACAADWVGYVIIAPALGWALARAFLLPQRFTPRFKVSPYIRWWALSVGIALGSLVLWLALFARAGQLIDWVGLAKHRTDNDGKALGAVLGARRAWIAFSFTPLAVRLGIWAAPVCVLRWVALRVDEEAYALCLLFGAVVQYLGFPQWADVHIYWPHYFAPYFALALAQLASTLGAAAGFVARHIARVRAAGWAAWVTLGLGLLPALAIAHDGVLSLWVWRRTGGRYDAKGTLIRSELDVLTVLEQVINPATVRGTPLDAHRSIEWGWEHEWKYRGIKQDAAKPLASTPSAASHPFWIARASGLSSDEQRAIAAQAHVRVYGDVWLVDQREPPAPIDAYSLNEQEPSFFRWLLFDPTELHRTVASRPDPWLTWEWRTHLGMVEPAPTASPRDIDELRIAHNAAVVRGDTAAAEGWREKIEAQIDRRVAAKFDTGLELIGVRRIGGVQPRIEAWFVLAAGSFAGDAFFDVRSNVERRSALSLIPADTVDRAMAWPEPLPTKLWRPHCMYKTTFVLNHRIGVERYSGRWTARDGSAVPRRTDSRPDTVLALVE
jgi:4-amino-4-deoxy-L-arabinose transferase-like glycosyltransferase